ncbi:hypothetical protein BDU57DRAFT_582486 [Ampelomyces quisqualis]|uniref:Uncharacterized protein n=1 Tax=Ampelomyces quisqualis TaxID=50730 RepID=A0A6A5QCV1_AMPQU|nr:hypothetical protein BDU57DRAFT_582486 [Ampelomyces quisqualis]
MKYIIFLTIALVAFASVSSAQLKAHDVADLVARDTYLNPTRLSVLSVLRTAIPSGSNFPRPTGDFVPEWYQKLPEDVKSLLPSLYPATVAEISATSELVSSPQHFSTHSCSRSYLKSPITTTILISSTTHITVTKTVHYAPSLSTGTGVPSNGSSTISTPSNGTMSTGLPSPSVPPFLGGANSVVKVETLAALAWVGLAAGFFLFA